MYVCWQQEDEEMLVPHSDLVEGPQPMEGFISLISILNSLTVRIQ